MTIIRNKGEQNITINFKGGKNRVLPGRAMMTLTPEELSSEHVRNLLISSKITIAGTDEPQKKKWTPQLSERTGTDASAIEEKTEAEEPAISEQEEPEEMREQERKKTGYVRKKK